MESQIRVETMKWSLKCINETPWQLSYSDDRQDLRASCFYSLRDTSALTIIVDIFCCLKDVLSSMSTLFYQFDNFLGLFSICQILHQYFVKKKIIRYPFWTILQSASVGKDPDIYIYFFKNLQLVIVKESSCLFWKEAFIDVLLLNLPSSGLFSPEYFFS